MFKFYVPSRGSLRYYVVDVMVGICYIITSYYY